MDRSLVVALLVVVVVPVRADETAVKEVEKAIDALNKAFEKADARTVKSLMTEDHLAVTTYYGGAQTRAEQLEKLGDHKFKEYKAGKMKVRLLGKDSALVNYPLTLDGTYKGKAVPRKNHASAVWVRQGGKWLEVFYQETPLMTD